MYTDLAEYYNEWEPDDLNPEPKKTFEQVNSVLRSRYVSSVVDIGCGTGTYALFCAAAGYSVVGIDMSDAMIAQAKRKASAMGLKTQFFRGEAVNLVLPSKFDAVIALNLVHHFRPQVLLSAIKNWRDQLNPSGIILLNFLDQQKVSKLRVREHINTVKRTNSTTLVRKWSFKPSGSRSVTKEVVWLEDSSGFSDYSFSWNAYLYSAQTVQQMFRKAGLAKTEFLSSVASDYMTMGWATA